MPLDVLTDAHRCREQAFKLWRLGLSVIPIPRPRLGVPIGQPGDGKVPAIPWREYQTRLATEDEIREWFSREPMNIAIVTGKVSGIVVVDADSPEAVRFATRRLPWTPWQTQSAKGFHFAYGYPDVPVRNKARIATEDGKLALDLRADGGYVIAPGSIHFTGVEYIEGGDWSQPKSDLPMFWVGWLAQRKRTAPASPTHSHTRPVGLRVERARRYLAKIPLPEIGCGSDQDTLYAACRLVRGFMLSAPEAEDLLWEWAGGREGWTRDWIAEKVRNAERYGTEMQGRYA